MRYAPKRHNQMAKMRRVFVRDIFFTGLLGLVKARTFRRTKGCLFQAMFIGPLILLKVKYLDG